MKQLKFNENLIPLILNRTKYVTWRLFDDKDLETGDELEFINARTREKFAKALVVQLREKELGQVNDEDEVGHEQIGKGEELLKHYSKLYGRPVGFKDRVKIIQFKLI